MRKYQLKWGFRDGSVAPQDFVTGKVFIGSCVHEYAEPTEFIELMLEGGYIEEVFDEVKPAHKSSVSDEALAKIREQMVGRKRRGRPKVNGQLTAD